MTTEPTNPQETATMTLNTLRTLTRMAADIRDKQLQLGRALPPVRYGDLIADGNFRSRAFERDVDDFMRKHMTPIDTTLLDRDDPDKWELMTPRYEVLEGSIDTDEGELTVWRIFDHGAGALVLDTESDPHGDAPYPPLTFAREDDATDKRYDLEREDEENRYGFPFAWNTGWVVEEGTYWLDELRSAGFLVYRYDFDAVIAGIDGGGYSFKGAHFAPLYAALAAKNDWLVETDDGPRRITVA